MASVSEPIGDYVAVIEVEPPGIARLRWETNDGKRLRSAPKDAIRNFAERHKEIKEKLKSIKNTIRIQTDRIESSYSDERSTPYDDWWTHYALHPLMKTISSSLIWQFRDRDVRYSAILQDGELILADNSPAPELSASAEVSLWHPLHADSEEHDAWRNYIWRHSVVQPFRQAYREVYGVTEQDEIAEIVSGLYVRQHQFRALLIERGWSYRFRGSFDCDSSASKSLSGGFRCVINVADQSTATSARGIALAVELAAIEIYKDDKQVSLESLSPILSSEVFREIDLLTAVSGLGYEGDWDDIEKTFKDSREDRVVERLSRAQDLISELPTEISQEVTSYQKALLNFLVLLDLAVEKRPIPETTKTRAYLLRLMLQESEAADKTRVEGRYAFVDGLEGSYKINLASGLIFDCVDNSLLGVAPKRKDVRISGEPSTDILLARIYSALLHLAGIGSAG